MAASRHADRGLAIAIATGACHASTETTTGLNFSRRRTSGAANPATTAPSATGRRARDDLKAGGVWAPGRILRSGDTGMFPLFDARRGGRTTRAGGFFDRNGARVRVGRWAVRRNGGASRPGQLGRGAGPGARSGPAAARDR